MSHSSIIIRVIKWFKNIDLNSIVIDDIALLPLPHHFGYSDCH